ncbi:MAG: hypothetical protein A2289_03435 [Deltaproteobacteria bacterium RIFOXYA12_FULL_58_15]|nr:MAG: hypothetical protein A2289_03435 [Deltaproteobacteria bacterium RIFOXYA12_FULL_58_15]OGR14239.1 MAG: hypothetical protein A2341_13530 [Deltaproteobacteria bacterium RIFOXYB12_FULL_58_9]
MHPSDGHAIPAAGTGEVERLLFGDVRYSARLGDMRSVRWCMHGAKFFDEWCWDARADYPSQSVIDPEVSPGDAGLARMARGGSWSHYAGYVRAAQRLYSQPGVNGDLGGLRGARTAH